jgi:hypothetical protein
LSRFLVLYPGQRGTSSKADASLLKLGNGFLDIGDFPAEHGLWRGSEILGLANTDHGFPGSHYQGKHVIADEMEPQFAFVKASCFRGIFG